jgi:TolB-like protein/tetratricopeptide (TPR) repeat protein
VSQLADDLVDAVRNELDKVLASELFARSQRLSRFLRFTVEQSLLGEGDKLKEYIIGIEVFDKRESFDPRTDTVVRVEARRLRSALTEYYAGDGRDDPLRIAFPKGGYAPVFEEQPRVVLQSPPLSSIAVIPFVNMSADPANEYFSDGLTEELINVLARVEGLRVVARTSVFQFKGKADDIRHIGKLLNVGVVLEGSVRQEKDRLRVTAQLNNTADGYHLWSETYEFEMKNVFAIQDEIARAIVETLKIKKGPGHLVWPHTENLEAYNLYLKGRHCWNKRTAPWVWKGIDYFKSAIENDPKYARAYAGLADSYCALGFSFDAGALPPREAMPKAEAALRRALELDDRLAEAHVSMAFVRFLYDWDWTAAEAEFRRALELNPRYAHAHHWYSHFLLAVGRTEASLAESRRCLELDPLDAILCTHMGWHYLYSHQYDLAIEELHRALDMHPNYPLSQRELGRAYSQKGMYREGIAALQKEMALWSGDAFALSALGYSYGTSGDKAEAHKVLEKLIRMTGDRYVSPYYMAAVYAGMGEPDQGLTWLERAYEDRSDLLVYLGIEPMFESLHSHPRFVKLLKQIGLESRSHIVTSR